MLDKKPHLTGAAIGQSNPCPSSGQCGDSGNPQLQSRYRKNRNKKATSRWLKKSATRIYFGLPASANCFSVNR
jgi:hypothetical protein